MCCFFVNSRRRDVVGCPRMADTLLRLYCNTTIWHARVFLRCISALAQSRKDDITAYMDGYAVGCRRVIIDRHCSVYRCHNFMSHSGKLAQQCNVECRALVRPTRNKLVIGCIDPSSANISFVLNPVPYNCLQISR